MRLFLTVMFCLLPLSAIAGNVYVLDSGINIPGVTYGQDFISNSNIDCHGHGTAMAQISNIPATAIISVRIFNCANLIEGSSLDDGIAWVAARATQGDMVLLALNTTETNPNYARDIVIEQSIDNGVSWVIAAGNRNDWAFLYSPARMGRAVIVGAANGLERAAYSNFGPSLDVFSDGCDQGWCGTSVAAARIAGRVYTLLQQMPWAPPAHISNSLINSCTSIMTNPGPGTTGCKHD